MKGQYGPNTSFVTEKVKMKESMGFNIEELQGNIDAIDADSHTIDMVGMKVIVTEKTSIEL